MKKKQRIKKLEKRIAELEKKVAAQPEDTINTFANRLYDSFRDFGTHAGIDHTQRAQPR